MLRSQVIQSVLDLKQAPAYLEIGVNQGLTFHDLKANIKVAVDPDFLFDVAKAERDNANSSYYAITSDVYFASLSRETLFDVIYLDGLHTFEQTLRDLLNAIEYIKGDGIIIIDDVRPTSYAASLKTMEAAGFIKSLNGDPDPAWMGDVYRLVWFIDTFMQQWSYRTVADNHGQIVMWRERRSSDQIVQRLVEQVGALTFEQMAVDSATFRTEPMTRILDHIRAAQG